MATVDALIGKILSVGLRPLTKAVSEQELLSLCTVARDAFIAQSSLIELDAPVKICGDTHGQFPDLIRLFDKVGFPPCTNYLFLGDYVDRGKQSLETITLLICYKVKYPDNFFLLRGNHECAAINRTYGFYEECQRRYRSTRIWQGFQDVFSCMPLVALVGGKILCMHGGLSPKINSLDGFRQLSRPIEPVPENAHIDVLWSDPENNVKGFVPNPRGVSVAFGVDVVNAAVKTLNIDLIVRAHQVVQDGYEFFANRKLVTIFSAPHYCQQFDNAAAVLNVDECMSCTFTILRPVARLSRLGNAKQNHALTPTSTREKDLI